MITPSLPAATYDELATLVRTLTGLVTMFQVDIVDGHFVPHTSWPFTEPNPWTAFARLSQLTEQVAIEVDCMVIEPERYLDIILKASVASVIVHWGSTETYRDVVNRIRASGAAAGLAFTNDVPLGAVIELVPTFDFVQVMGIAAVGAQGQPFDERTLDTVRTLRAHFPDLHIAIDGAVNATTIPFLKEAGASRFAPGSAIAKASDPSSAYKQLDILARG